MLGYGGTDKPTDPAAYVPSLLARDVVDVLDAEELDRVVAVGHDWGALVVSRLANHYPGRFLAYAFLAVPFVQVTPPMDHEVFLEHTKQRQGRETFGFWSFFSKPDADAIIQAHMDSFVSVLFPHDPEMWKTRLGPTGALEQSLRAGFVAPRPAYWSAGDAAHFAETFRRDGFAAPTCWYKVLTSGLAARDDQQIPEERLFPPVDAPLYFGAAKKDCVCVAEAGLAVFGQEAFRGHRVTTKEYEADHWLILSNGEEIAGELDGWIEGTGVAKL
ncbi:uncharacterized protein PHACADRAFT_262639 [Phanerochaete carnosa HHB-10118-sp]|uniref:AB hydrolase-1 domain-containing protein n=1 Tax=Phanerochaete carnosa (strain HHB-10118-sp) TaxID=650164 RepID=K5VZ63_PHACS|nr:uncharacterized protein PHACADRAFT_262639 [Phanerochaete carnosa HHB-10118-sp]EKM52130.1 hypothetical protein PHACADRAFT_262639 [Phanerochaete carnosa HHB-10118-sp]